MPVPQYYTMDPETELMVPSGDWLRVGMVVLIANPYLRANENNREHHQKNRYQIANRWCEVSYLQYVVNGHLSKIPMSKCMVQFIGIYGDGSKHQRRANIYEGWLVKK